MNADDITYVTKLLAGDWSLVKHSNVDADSLTVSWSQCMAIAHHSIIVSQPDLLSIVKTDGVESYFQPVMSLFLATYQNGTLRLACPK